MLSLLPALDQAEEQVSGLGAYESVDAGITLFQFGNGVGFDQLFDQKSSVENRRRHGREGSSPTRDRVRVSLFGPSGRPLFDGKIVIARCFLPVEGGAMCGEDDDSDFRKYTVHFSKYGFPVADVVHDE